MILPNKLFSFDDSLLSKISNLLEHISGKSMRVTDLYNVVEKDYEDINDFILLLDVLFALGAIIYNEKLEVIEYVKVS